MNDVKKRKVPSASLKAKIGLEAIRGLKTLNEIGQEYGVHPLQVGQYKKLILTQADKLFEIKRGPKRINEHAEPERLHSEISKLKLELDWLKRKTGVC